MRKLSVVLIIIVMLSIQVVAVGVTPSYAQIRNPTPGDEYYFEFYFSRDDGGPITFNKRAEGLATVGQPGYLEEKLWYDSILVPKQVDHTEWKSKSTAWVFSGTWPKFEMPGVRRIYLSGADSIPDTEEVGSVGLAAVSTYVEIVIPYTGIHINPLTHVDNIYPGDEAILNYTVNSIGLEKSPSVYMDVDVFRDSIISSTGTNIEFGASNVSTGILSLGFLDPGHYVATSTFTVDGREWVVESPFVVADQTLSAECPELIVEAALLQDSFRILSGYIEPIDRSISLRIGDGFWSSDVQLSPLDTTSVLLLYDLSAYNDGEYGYSLLDGSDELCAGTLQVISQSTYEIPGYVYVVFGSFILVVVFGLFAYYYFSRDDEEEVDF